MKRKQAKNEARNVARELLELSLSTGRSDAELAKRQAALARRIMLKFNVRFDWTLKRFYCHGCKKLLVPGLNARVRLREGVVRMTCTECGFVNRKLLPESARLNIKK